MQFRSESPAETRALGARVGGALAPGAVVGLSGPLGAGKTVFVQGMAEAMGLAGPVVSPTFAVLCVYPGTPPLVHMDAYRVAGADDLESTGFFDYLDGHSILAVEWAGRIADLLPDGVIWVSLEPAGDGARDISIEGACLCEPSR